MIWCCNHFCSQQIQARCIYLHCQNSPLSLSLSFFYVCSRWWLPLEFNILVYTHSDDVIHLISHSYNDLPRLLMTMTSLLLSCRQTCARLNLFFFFASNIQYLFCQYHTHIQARTWTKSRLTGIFDVFFSLFLYYTSVCTYRHVPLFSSVRHRGERTHLFPPLSLSPRCFFFFSIFLGHSLVWLSDSLARVMINGSITTLSNSGDLFWKVQWQGKKKKSFASHSHTLTSQIELSSDALESNC